MVSKNVKVGKYTIRNMIAKGGMGKIYRAKHPTLNRDVILKRLTLVGNKTITERFKREARIMLDFREDRIVQVYDHFKEGASYYIVMEYINGMSLAELIDSQRYLPNDIAVLIFYETCRALKYAHDKGVIHRDIKPENILISRDGAVKLTDFGIATSNDCKEECLTKNMTLGTPAYMSPEQIEDSSSVDNRADIYSMGVLLYKMVTGKCPFPGNMTPETINLITKGKYRPPRKINPKVTPFVQDLIVKAMHRSPFRRYNDLDIVIAKLEKRLRKYRNSEIIKKVLRTFIFGSDSSGKTRRIKKQEIILPDNKTRKKLIISVITAAILGISIFYGFSKNYHYEFYKSDKYGAFTIDYNIGENRKDDILYIDGTIFIKEKNKYVPAENIFLAFTKSFSDKNNIYSTGRIYGKSGEYKAVIKVNSTTYEKDFFLKSRNIQKTEFKGLRAMSISLSPLTFPSLPLSIRYKVNDGITMGDITDSSEIYIFLMRRWMKLDEIKKSDSLLRHFKTGRNYTFMFTASGYRTKFKRIKIKRNQPFLKLDVDMIPLPGVLLIKSNKEGTDLFINNSSHYIHCGRKREIKDVKPLGNKYQRYLLSPGNYFIASSYGDSKEITEVTIKAGNRKVIRVHYNDNNQSLHYKIY